MKNLNCLLVVGILILVLPGCSFDRESQITKNIYVENGLVSPKPLHLSEIADSVSYVAIQTDSTCLVGAHDRFQLTRDNIIIFGEKCLLFNRDGVFVRTIGKKGKGPGEYASSFGGFVFDNEVYIPNEKNLLVYDLNGNFTKTIYGDNNYLWKYPIGNNHYLGYRSYLEKLQPWCFSISSSTEDSLITLSNYTHLDVNNGIQSNDECIVAFDKNQLLFRELYNDTIFSINADKKIKPEYILNSGKFLLSLTSKSGWTKANMMEKMKEYNTNYFRTNAMLTSSKYVFLNYKYTGQNQVGYFSKKGGDFNTYIDKEKAGSFENDLDGGIRFIPSFGNSVTDELAMVIWPFDILQHLESHQESEFSKKISARFSALKETDNPVLMLVKLKE